MNRSRSGQVRIVEAFLAVFIVFSAFAVSANLAPSKDHTGHRELEAVGLRTLACLDSEGSLGRCVDDQNWSRLGETIGAALPTGVWFNVTVYDEEMRILNSVVITNGGLVGYNIASVEYACATTGAVFRCYLIRVQLAVAS